MNAATGIIKHGTFSCRFSHIIKTYSDDYIFFLYIFDTKNSSCGSSKSPVNIKLLTIFRNGSIDLENIFLNNSEVYISV